MKDGAGLQLNIHVLTVHLIEQVAGCRLKKSSLSHGLADAKGGASARLIIDLIRQELCSS